MLLTFHCPECDTLLEVSADQSGMQDECPDCGTTVTIPVPRIQPGTILGNFRIEEKIGSGGMGDVFLATQVSMGRTVALKVLPLAMTRNKQLVERFIHEVRMTARLEHPNIVTAFEAGEDTGYYFLAMSYVDGDSLSDILKRDGSLPEGRALGIGLKVADALSYAWDEYQILHRDIKPSNIMIDRSGRTKLMDMGVSKSLIEDIELTTPGLVVGTPHYMSPEQARNVDIVDFRSDIYSLGATLYYCVTGTRPYEGTSVVEVLTKHVLDSFPSPQERNPAVSDGCAHLLEVMMAKDPKGRPKSWKELMDGINLVLQGQPPVSSRPKAGESVIGPVQKMGKKHKGAATPEKAETDAAKSPSVVPKQQDAGAAPGDSKSAMGRIRAMGTEPEAAPASPSPPAEAASAAEPTPTPVPAPSSAADERTEAPPAAQDQPKRSAPPRRSAPPVVTDIQPQRDAGTEADTRHLKRVAAALLGLLVLAALVVAVTRLFRQPAEPAPLPDDQPIVAQVVDQEQPGSKADIVVPGRTEEPDTAQSDETAEPATGAPDGREQVQPDERTPTAEPGPEDQAGGPDGVNVAVQPAEPAAVPETPEKQGAEPVQPGPEERTSASQDPFMSLIAKTVADLLGEGAQTASRRLEEAQVDPELEPFREQLTDLSALLLKAIRTRRLIHDSFRGEVGTRVDVDLGDGPETLMIRNVDDKAITGAIIGSRGHTIGLRSRQFTVDDLSNTEKLKRLRSVRPREETLLTCGVLYLHEGDLEAARRCFERSRDILRADLLKGVERAFLDKLSGALLNLEFSKAIAYFEERDAAANLSAEEGSLSEVEDVVLGLKRIPRVLLESFRSQLGEPVAVELKEGSVYLLLTSAESDGLSGRIMDRRFRTVGRKVVRFTVDELSPNEAVRRLPRPSTGPEFALYHGLLLLDQSDTAGGEKCLQLVPSQELRSALARQWKRSRNEPPE